jgi:hypothetical protein
MINQVAKNGKHKRYLTNLNLKTEILTPSYNDKKYKKSTKTKADV